ncbi:MAG: S8 family serine peptidase [Candidatus Thorarchaeota archaeon]|jgi:subtilisin family serine protease
MSFKNKAATLLLVAFLTLSVFMAPVGIVSRAEVASSPELSPAAQDEINNWYDMMAQPGFTPDIDATLADWIETGIVTDQMVTNNRGVSAMVVVAPNTNMDAIREVVDVDMFVNLGYFTTMKVTMSGPDAANKLAKIDGVGIIDADQWRLPIKDDLVKELDIAPVNPQEGVDMAEIWDVVNADTAGYTGSGITVGHVDTGADFGNPALQHAYNIGSYDGTGEGLVPMYYSANSSYVSNTTAWAEDGNLLTYVTGDGTVMLNVTGWDPALNNAGGPRHLYGDGSASSPYNARVGYIWLYAYFWGIAINSTWLDTTMMDWELPANNTAGFTLHGDYQVNWAYQQQTGPYAKIFAPAMTWVDASTDAYKLAINWEDADAWQNLWTGGFYYETLNMSHTVAGDLGDIYGLFDWNFTDDVEDEVFDLTNPIVAHDYSDNGIDDFSLGSLSWCYDADGWGDDVMFQGFSEDGDFCLYWDDGSHGTATAAHVVGKNGALQFYQSDNDMYVTMDGIAPDADMISVRALSGNSDYFSYLWLAGFDMVNETSGEFNYTGNHMADLVTNSWGWVTEPSSQMNYLAFTWEILSTPGILDVDNSYPGVLHVFSAGNEGSGYMTIGPPGAATSVLTVGASTTSHWLEYLYGPTQPYEGMASFSSRGPSFTGYPKPDVLAPGLAGYSTVPWYSDYYAGVWDIGASNTTLFSGTSQAAPVAAGVAALAMEAYGFDSVAGDNPMIIKAIIQHTADDLGYDAAIQGFGRVNAEVACDFADGTSGAIGATQDSMFNYAQFMGDAWAYWGILPGGYVPRDVNSTVVDFPDDIYDGSIFFGQLMPGDSATVTYSIYTDEADVFGTPDNSDYVTGSDGWILNMTDMFTFDNVTYSYNDTNLVGEQMYGWYDLSDQLSSSDYADVMAANMIQIVVSFDAADVAGAEPWMFLYD